MSYLETLVILSAAERRQARPRGLRRFRYEGRYILADGRPRSFRVDAHNLSDAAAAIERQAREELGAAFASSRCYRNRTRLAFAVTLAAISGKTEGGSIRK